jgi:antibiotic biosynthesis monooxygenase (ABM) superfamily enzyme
MAIVLVVTLTVRTESVEDFRAFERAAAKIMADHGGRIERTIVVPATDDGDPWREVHVVRFPNDDSLAAYRLDDRLLALAEQRERAIIQTTILTGADGPDYHDG